jgi:lipid A 3-O-deacylase
MKYKPLKAKLFIIIAGLAAVPAEASEIFGGVYSHDVETALTRSGFERGADFQLGWRGGRIEALRAIGAPSPQVFASVNSAGDTNYAAAGIAWKLGKPLYIRPGVGIAVHDGPGRVVPGDQRIDFGSRVLAELEFGVGLDLGGLVSAELSWVHLSHGQLLSPQNPGIDNIGLRLNYRFR